MDVVASQPDRIALRGSRIAVPEGDTVSGSQAQSMFPGMSTRSAASMSKVQAKQPNEIFLNLAIIAFLQEPLNIPSCVPSGDIRACMKNGRTHQVQPIQIRVLAVYLPKML